MEDVPPESSAFLDRAYQLLMTPLPMGMLPSLDIDGLMSALHEHGRRVGALTDLPERLPQMPPEWMEYARREGLVPPQGPAMPSGLP